MIDVVAIDGPSGAGKSTVAKMVAEKLGWNYLDTGAMYRSVGLKAFRKGVALDDDTTLEPLCAATVIEFGRSVDSCQTVILDGEDVTAAIREHHVSDLASRVSARLPVRRAMAVYQRKIGETSPTVCEGRDMGTVVFPDAMVKVFMTASTTERARRRTAELEARGETVDFARILADIEERDGNDSSRAHSPLKPAADSVEVDTTGMTIDQVVETIVGLVSKNS